MIKQKKLIENTAKNKYKHCCEILEEDINDPRIPLFFDKQMRNYEIHDTCDCRGKKTTIVMANKIIRCPWCGTKLPKALSTKWEETLEQEYGLDEPWSEEQKKKIPKEFHSDEWWKKRGL